MCGIAGFLNYDYRHDYFRQVNRIQIHRGPDHQGSWFSGPVALFHQRLSIIDLLEKANQPFEKEGLVIIYNGEIYNYPELLKELKESRGINFITHSDTEVILELLFSVLEHLFCENCIPILASERFIFNRRKKGKGLSGRSDQFSEVDILLKTPILPPGSNRTARSMPQE